MFHRDAARREREELSAVELRRELITTAEEVWRAAHLLRLALSCPGVAGPSTSAV